MMMKRVWNRGLAAVWMSTIALAGCLGESPEQMLASAKSHIEKKDSKAALIQLKNALQKDASLAEARFLLAKVLLDSGDVAGAAIELGKTQELKYVNEEMSAMMARILFQQGKLDKLVADYGETKLTDPKVMADLQTTLASAAILRSQIDQAKSRLDNALRLDPDSLRAQLLRVNLLANSEGPAAALPALEQVLSKAPASSEAWKLKGDLLALSARVDEAKIAFHEALKLDKRNVGAHTGLLSLLMAKRDADATTKALDEFKAALPNHPLTKLFSASHALEAGDLKAAREHLQVLLKVMPDDARVQFLAGSVEFRQGALLQAETHLAKALKINPNWQRARLLLARTHLRAGEVAKAMAVLQPALDAAQPDADALAAAAEAQFQLGNAKLAEEYLTRAAKLNPQDMRSRTALAMVSIAQGRSEQGIGELRAISASDAGGTADLALISTLVRKGELDKALQAIDALERKQPGKPVALMLRGRVELTRGKQAQAREAFEAALRADPVYYPAAASLAAMDVADKKPDVAIQRFEKMLATNPKHVQAQMAIIGLRSQSGATKQELAELLSKAVSQNPEAVAPRAALIRLQIERKENKLALAVAQEGVAAVPGSPELLELQGQALAATGDTNQALIAFNKMAALQPSSPQAFMRIAELHMASKDQPAALQSLKKALSIKADYAPAQTAFVTLQLLAGKTTEARSMTRTIQQQRPEDPLGYSLEGDVEVQQKNWPKASAAYRASLDKRAQTDTAMKLHRSLVVSGKKDEAKAFENRWRKDHAKDIAFVYYLGDVALSQSDQAQALVHYQDVLKISPDNAAANNNVAWLLKTTKKPGALEYAEKANRLSPNQPAFMDTLAEIHAEAGQWNKALEIQKQAVTLAPEQHLHRLHLARYYLQAGQKAEARLELDRLAALGDQFDKLAEVRKMQAEL